MSQWNDEMPAPSQVFRESCACIQEAKLLQISAQKQN